MRDVASYKVLEDMGLAAPKTAWYDLYIDYGQGLERLGVSRSVLMFTTEALCFFTSVVKSGKSLAKAEVYKLMKAIKHKLPARKIAFLGISVFLQSHILAKTLMK